jgi:hypothetical protein
MYTTLYMITGMAFVASVAAYMFFCVRLSADIKNGRVPLKAEGDKK